MRIQGAAQVANGRSQVFIPDSKISSFLLGYAIVVSAGADLDWELDYTTDDVFSTSFNPATANWVPFGSGSDVSGSGNLSIPCTGVSLNVTGYVSGSVVPTIIQGGTSD